MDESENIKKLAQRYLTTCERIYITATARNDIETAAHAALSALSVALNCAIDLGQESSRETAVVWHKLLNALDVEANTSEYLTKSVKWADRAMRAIYTADKNNLTAGTGGN